MIALDKTPKQLLRHCSSAAQAMLGEHRANTEGSTPWPSLCQHRVAPLKIPI